MRNMLRREGNFLIILDGEGLDSSTSNIRTRMLTAQILLTTLLDILVRAVRQEKQTQEFRLGRKEGMNLSICRWFCLVYRNVL